MLIIVLIVFVVLFTFFPLLRLIIFNLHLVGIYSVIDLRTYFKERKYSRFNFWGIDLFVGNFGSGKTLAMTHRARLIYKKYGSKVRFISNYDLKDIPYIPLINFNQLIDLGEDSADYEGTVVLIDEIENVLSHRNYANFPLPLLHMLTQQRKKRVYIMSSCQKFQMVDKLWRMLTNNVIKCSHIWRFMHCEIFDAWSYDNASDLDSLKRLTNIWWFAKNQDYASYNTLAMVSKQTAEDFISNDTVLVRKGLDLVHNNTVTFTPISNHGRRKRK